MDAVTHVATSGSATPQVRVLSVRHLIRLVNVYSMYTYYGLTIGERRVTDAEGNIVVSSGCHHNYGSERATRVGTPLPDDYEARFRLTLSALVNSPSAPSEVRQAASCLR